jgi:hypothetical protein
MEEQEITEFLRHRGARYRQLLSKTADPVAAARYRDLIEALHSVADGMGAQPGSSSATRPREQNGIAV